MPLPSKPLTFISGIIYVNSVMFTLYLGIENVGEKAPWNYFDENHKTLMTFILLVH